VDFRLLGLLEVDDDGDAVELPRGKERALLAVLLLNANEPVSSDRLIDHLWGEQPPANAAKTVQVYVSRLRKAIGAAELQTTPGGYVLAAAGEQVDVRRFERLAREGRAQLDGDEPERAERLLSEALELWRGPPLADFAFEPFAQAEVRRLEELRSEVVADRVEARLAQGRNDAVFADLDSLVQQNPLWERPRRLLMLALYRAGRQADALELYRATRVLLRDELGLEPSPELRELEQQILRHDPALRAPRAPLAERARARRGLLLLVGGLLVLAGGVAAGVIELTSRGGAGVVATSANSLAAIDAKNANVLAAPQVGDTPTAVAVGSGAVWVLNAGEQTLSRVDPRSRTVVRTIPVGSPPSDVAVGAGSLWVTTSDFRVVRIDPASGAVLRTIVLPRSSNPLARGTAAAWVASNGAAVWATGDGSVVRLRPSLLRLFPGGPGCCNGIAIGYGSVWASDDAGITRIDARTGARQGRISLAFPASRLAVGAGAVWAIDANGRSVWAVDPRTDHVLRSIDVGTNPQGVAVGGGSVWVATAAGTVAEIDPRGLNVVRTTHVGGTPAGIAVGAGQVWVSLD